MFSPSYCVCVCVCVCVWVCVCLVKADHVQQPTSNLWGDAVCSHLYPWISLRPHLKKKLIPTPQRSDEKKSEVKRDTHMSRNCVRTCVCVREREKERETGQQEAEGQKKEREKAVYECLYVSVFVGGCVFKSIPACIVCVCLHLCPPVRCVLEKSGASQTPSCIFLYHRPVFHPLWQ